MTKGSLDKQCGVTVVVSERDVLYRRGLVSLINSVGPFAVVGEASDPSETWDLLADHHPDVLLLSFDGRQASFVEQVRHMYPQVKIMLLTRRSEAGAVLTAARMGVSGCVLRTSTPEEIADTLRRVSNGESAICSEMRDTLLELLIAGKSAPVVDDLQKTLSVREWDVVKCLTEGMSNKEIALKLGLAERTVKAYVSNILRKMGVSDRTQIVIKVLKEIHS